MNAPGWKRVQNHLSVDALGDESVKFLISLFEKYSINICFEKNLKNFQFL